MAIAECKLTLNHLTDNRVGMMIVKQHPETLDMEPGDRQKC